MTYLMKNMISSFTVSILFLFTVSCGSSGGSGSNTTIDELEPPQPSRNSEPWLVQTVEFATPQATHCGFPGEDSTTRDEFGVCIRDAFEIYQPFYAAYEFFGVDSVIAIGIAFDGTRLFFVSADSFDCNPAEHCHKALECIEPRFRQFPIDYSLSLFLCNDTPDVPLGGAGL